MAHTFTNAEKEAVNRAVTLLTVGTAPEIVYPSGIHTDIVELVGQAADSSGFKTAGAFREAVANAPISTLLNFIKFVGVSDANLQHAIDWLEKSTAAELPLDAQVNYDISQAHGSFSDQLTLQQNLQDRPVSTLLQFLVYVAT